ncbi:hypothetical protein KOAAANKH_02107 [Brevundimonas sp. NIBR10]|nr:hypothetical protein KOAAANKH_02107 [Brevundimonas sp. NIBR10]
MDAARLHDEIDPVALRHQNIDDRCFAVLGGYELERAVHVGSTHDFETKSGDHVLQMLQHQWIVVDDANFHPAGSHGLC